MRGAKRAAERGNALLGIAMALIISAVVAAGYLVFFNNANNSAKNNDFMAQLAAVQTAVQSLYYGQSTYTGLDTATLADSGTLPEKMLSGSAIKHPFNADITVAPGGTNDTFVVTATNIPEASCTTLVTKDLGRSLVRLQTDVAGNAVNKRAMSPAEAQANCTDPGDGVITIIWEFY
ncbi:type IV pilus biogenesis protein, putative [Salipiger mucosus DSM 16094]|uniref:Type IV pilus biogenesis protein, putative n=2 Tax=Salipiger mucosus TaxID=263378 RepID=S9SBB9_9RHOB|nr:type IV pilus biogenesis protein, putative [Salipiger mucosus DSM 16094]